MNTEISLNGLWNFVVDLEPRYHDLYLGAAYAQPGFDRRSWMKVTVPGVWNRYSERYDLFEGVAWLAREFTLDHLSRGTRAVIRFGAVNYIAAVYLNGELAGEHEGGYTEFIVDVTALLSEGSNTIALRVENRSHMLRYPAVKMYYNYGGIHRDVTLELYPGAHLADLSVEAVPAGSAGGSLTVSARVANLSAGSHTLSVRCADSDASVAVLEDGPLILELQVPETKAWSPSRPALYALEVEIHTDGELVFSQQREIGFRAIRRDGIRLLLNDELLHLRGVNYLYDSPTLGCTMAASQYETDLDLLAELGVNAIRSHLPLPEEFLRACDRRGLLVWMDIPIFVVDPRLHDCQEAFRDPAWRELALTMAEEAIRQANLHPCVIVYGIGNECRMEMDGADAFFRALAAHCRALDRTRLLGYACDDDLAGAAATYVDVLGFNVYWGWYDVLDADGAGESAIDLSKLVDLLSHADEYGVPYALTEFGADAIPGYNASSGDLWSEQYQATLLKKILEVADVSSVCGTFPFVFCDYRDPSKPASGRNELNYKGVVDYNRNKKLAFKMLKEAYGRRAES